MSSPADTSTTKETGGVSDLFAILNCKKATPMRGLHGRRDFYTVSHAVLLSEKWVCPLGDGRGDVFAPAGVAP